MELSSAFTALQWRDSAANRRTDGRRECSHCPYVRVLICPCSALHFAAALGKVDCAKLLLEAGADPNLQDTQGRAQRVCRHSSKQHKVQMQQARGPTAVARDP